MPNQSLTGDDENVVNETAVKFSLFPILLPFHSQIDSVRISIRLKKYAIRNVTMRSESLMEQSHDGRSQTNNESCYVSRENSKQAVG